MYLVLVDAYSKSVSAEVMQTITGKKLFRNFETHGIPHKIVRDNGPTFQREQFQTFI